MGVFLKIVIFQTTVLPLEHLNASCKAKEELFEIPNTQQTQR